VGRRYVLAVREEQVNRVAIIQARMTSTRLPGKVLADLEGRPMLARQLERMRRATSIDEIVIATTVNADDDPVVNLARTENVRWFRGSEHDVLTRYVEAAREAAADLVIRITADCPLIDPEVIDLVVGTLANGLTEMDYASNVLRRTYPRGLDVEAMTSDTLERVGRLARSPDDREHVTRYILVERPDLFLVGSVEDSQPHNDLRWTVDHGHDLALVRRLYQEMKLTEEYAGYRDIIAHTRSRTEGVE
jgi:spore coat polysaccharide biosynthesis protein SpsF